MNKKKAFIFIAIFWLIIILGFIAFKEFTLQTGAELLLKTVPVDPRDLFRGDYVVLSYEISTINTADLSVPASQFKPEDKVFVLLTVDQAKIASLLDINTAAPSNQTFLKGTVKKTYKNFITVEYGIESYFVPEGKGKKIEREVGNLYTKVAVDKFGNAVIKSLVLDNQELKVK